ncbi:Anticodon binding domain-containing protein [Bartonella sp. 11B]|nr:Anticodon binding domain-containing protein [Bartonella sp. 11B]
MGWLLAFVGKIFQQQVFLLVFTFDICFAKSWQTSCEGNDRSRCGLMMDKEPEALVRYQKMVMRLRQAGIRSELYLGASGIKAQMKYADRRRAPCVVIQGHKSAKKEKFRSKIWSREHVYPTKLKIIKHGVRVDQHK